MAVKPVDDGIRLAVSSILSKFMSDFGWSEYSETDGRLEELRGQVVDTYEPYLVDSRTLLGELNNGKEVEMRDQHRFLFLKRIEGKDILPLLTLQTSDHWVHFRIYALLTMLDEDATLQSLAIRFETDEGDNQPGSEIGSHDFCHAQLCNYINKHIKDVTPLWVPDSQLAIPIDANTQIGLVLCMLTSLYGGRYVRRRFNPAEDRDLLKYLSKVRALRSPNTTG